MNWLQQFGASLFGLNSFIYEPGLPYTEQWGNDYFIIDPKSDFTSYTSDIAKVQAVFSNPAVLKIFKLQCDMFSMGKFYVYRDGKSKKNDPFLKLIKNPNPFQQTSQFLWDYMFWKMIGNVYCYVDSDSINSDSNKLYFLDKSKMKFADGFSKFKDKIILSSASLNSIAKLLITYNYSDGTSQNFQWSRISHVADLSNGTGNWFEGRSTIDAIYEIISNGAHAIKSKNINVRYAGKYMVAGQADPNDVNKLPMGSDEKRDIETKMNGPKTVHAVKSMIDIKRFVEDASTISQLDQAWWDDYFKVGNLFGIPSEVLEAFNQKGATYENQEKARGAHVDYTLQPAGEQFCNVLEKRFGYDDRDIILSWDHLPFTQVFAKAKAEAEKTKSEALLNYMKAGIVLDEINATLDTEFTELDYEPAKRSNTSGQNTTSNGQNAAGQG